MNALQETLVARFCTTMQTTATSLTMDLSKTVDETTKASLIVVLPHIQNGEAEKQIRDLQEQARTMLIFHSQVALVHPPITPEQ